MKQIIQYFTAGKKPTTEPSKQAICNYSNNYYNDQVCVQVKNNHSQSNL